MVLESVFSGIVRIEMDYDAMIAAAKSDTVKKALGKLKAGRVGHLTFREGLETIRDEIDTKNNPKDVEEHLKKYRDALVILAMLDGNAAPANVNARVNAVRNAFTRRVSERKAARKAESAAKRTAKAPKTSAEKAANKAHKEQLAAEKKATLAERLAGLRAGPKGRGPEKAAAVEELLATITLDKPPAYIQDVIDKLRSQLLRFNKEAKTDAKLSIRKHLRELKGALEDKQEAGRIKPATAREYTQKIDALEILAGAVQYETNVELSNNNAMSVATTATSAGRSRAVGSPMSCKVLRHPCNPKIKINKEQLMRAAQQIMETGHALREPGFPGTEGAAKSSRSRSGSVAGPAASAAAAAASEGAAAGAGGKGASNK